MEKTYTIGFSHKAAFRDDYILVKNWVPDGVISGSWVMEEYNKGGYSPREGVKGQAGGNGSSELFLVM